jgi:succinyl-CoA synthetase beta subunit
VLLIEADGKALLAQHGIAVPEAVLVGDASIGDLPGEGPWIVKAQVPVGGRGKAGGIAHCGSEHEVAAAVQRMLGHRLKGHRIDACLVEQAVAGEERYLAIMVDAASYRLRVIYSAEGGVEIEQSGTAHSRLCEPDAASVVDALTALRAEPPVTALGQRLVELLLQREMALAEINPLFVSPEGCIAGDAKLVVDLSAVGRQPGIAALIEARP